MVRVDDANSALRFAGARVSVFGAVSECKEGDMVARGESHECEIEREMELFHLIACVYSKEFFAT